MDLLVLVEYDIVIEVASLGLNNLFVCDDKQCEQGEQSKRKVQLKNFYIGLDRQSHTCLFVMTNSVSKAN